MSQPHKGEPYDVPAFSLTDFLDPSKFKDDPVIVTGDAKISKDFGGLANLQTLPVVSPVGSDLVKVSLTALEMTAEKVTVRFRDQSGDGWKDYNIPIDIPDGNAEKATEILLGDHVESRDRLIINKQGTTTTILDKDITGSLLSPSVTVRTLDHP